MKINTNFNNHKAAFQGRISKDIDSIERLLGDRYGVNAYFNPGDLQGAQEMIETIQNLEELNFPLPDNVYTSIGKYIKHHPNDIKGIKECIGSHSCRTSSIVVKPDPVSRASYNLDYTMGIAACRKPASHEAGHNVSNKLGTAATSWGLCNVRLHPQEAQIAEVGLSAKAAYDIDEDGQLVTQTGSEYIAENIGAAIEGEKPIHPVLNVIQDRVIARANQAALQHLQSQGY